MFNELYNPQGASIYNRHKQKHKQKQETGKAKTEEGKETTKVRTGQRPRGMATGTGEVTPAVGPKRSKTKQTKKQEEEKEGEELKEGSGGSRLRRACGETC